MNNPLTQWLRKTYNKVITSIAFYPAIIAIGFLLFSWLMLQFDFSDIGKSIKTNYSWIRLRDASTARSIASTIAGGIISLMVFSFSMVMILLNQAASQMSNRMLESMIVNRFQQIVLGFYLGTIVYALFTVSTIRDVDAGIYIPALSIYLLLTITVVDIFLFIYFLHYVTQSVKFETIIERVHKQTLNALFKTCTANNEAVITSPDVKYYIVKIKSSGYYQGFDTKGLLKFTSKNKCRVEILHTSGTYLLQGQDLLKVYDKTELTEDEEHDLLLSIDMYDGQPIDRTPYFGFHQLAEVAIKALSPGINDPQTAVLSLHALTNLFYFRLHHFPKLVYNDEDDNIRIWYKEINFEQLLENCFNPIWDYGYKDRYIQNSMRLMLEQLISSANNHHHRKLLQDLLDKVNLQIEKTHNKQPV
ncbi:DUF2254 domain-containing protein [Mucilaginibacter segetis]|uniref:DUF2254 domain-containing protein n=1 Tax=Mucilaginibacter segetis TaxID=2793071 RepID=A0A934PWT6_9SPHI|nr:DUF2254 domain-containing protein [Mucilaginibacter segetis]MBK0381117.1 DUF2254 domain-containing protein [Mucilaginibacter segetis]